MAGQSGQPSLPRISPGQTIIFLGDHTSPDDPGYVAIVREVLERFHPELGLRLISAGSRGQTVAGIGSATMVGLLSAARPDWLVIGIGLADALREPVAREILTAADRTAREAAGSPLDATFGPEMRPGPDGSERVPDPVLEKLDAFTANLEAVVKRLIAAGIHVCLLTTIVPGNSYEQPISRVLAAYNRAIRGQAQSSGALLVDIERAFLDVFDRAANYKQKVTLTGTGGELNAQGQALVARSVLVALGLLPSGRGRRG